MARLDELRLMTKIARMYYEQELTQQEINERLGIHQSTVSRVLKRAQKEGVVRFIINVPSGTHPDLEEGLQSTFDLKDAVVVDCVDDEDQIVRDLGAASAFYLENTLAPRDVIGVSAWSAALLAMVEAMHPTQRAPESRVVQILGGIGSPGSAAHATALTNSLARLISAEPVLLPAPGIVGSSESRFVMMEDRFVRKAMELFERLTVALVGIGAIEPSKRLAASGNAFSPQELRLLSSMGAVGDICLRFFDGAGQPVVTPLNERVISIELQQLQQAKRVIGVAGGRRKTAAIRGALAGKLINVLITDADSARRLLEGAEASPRRNKSGTGARRRRAGTRTG
jgi:DNA-binding transcriptional regulator LsrR (DeoR family)